MIIINIYFIIVIRILLEYY